MEEINDMLETKVIELTLENERLKKETIKAKEEKSTIYAMLNSMLKEDAINYKRIIAEKELRIKEILSEKIKISIDNPNFYIINNYQCKHCGKIISDLYDAREHLKSCPYF